MEAKTQRGVVSTQVFWQHLFDAGEPDGVTIKIGGYRCCEINEVWAVMEIGGAYPTESFSARQDALDWMVDERLRTFKASGK